MVVWYSWDHQWFEFRFIINHDLFSIYREYYHFQVFYYPLRDSPAAFSIPAERERQKRGQSGEGEGHKTLMDSVRYVAVYSRSVYLETFENSSNGFFVHSAPQYLKGFQQMDPFFIIKLHFRKQMSLINYSSKAVPSV